MHLANLNKLINDLEHAWHSKQPVAYPSGDLVGFNMGAYLLKFDEEPEIALHRRVAQGDKLGDCGTVACIAGHCALRELGSVKAYNEVNLIHTNIISFIVKHLDLNWDQASALAFGAVYQYDRPGELADISISDTLDTLQRLRDTGQVKWPWDPHAI